MFVRDIPQADLQESLGGCLDSRGYGIVTAAANLLSEKGLIDTLVGEMSLCVCGNYVTLPPEVDSVLGVQVDGSPVLIRNEWFTYHLNGPGDQNWTATGFGDVLGQNYCTFRDPDRPVKLAASLRSATDNNKKIRFFGWKQDGERIYTPDANGTMQDGFYLPTVYGSLLTPKDVDPIVKIDRSFKDATTDAVDIYAVDPDTSEVISKLAIYRSNETQPRYLRIRINADNVVRIKYRRRDFKVSSLDDWVNVDHEEAFLLAIKAVAKRRAEQFDVADSCEATAVRLIKERNKARKGGGFSPPQVLVSTVNRYGVGLHYGN